MFRRQCWAITNNFSKPKGLFRHSNGLSQLHYSWRCAFKIITKTKYLQQICVTLLCQHVPKLYSHYEDGVTGYGLEGSWAVPSQCGETSSARPPPPPWKVVGATLLQHLTPRLWKFEGQKTARCQRPRGKEDRHSLGDTHERGKDAYS